MGADDRARLIQSGLLSHLDAEAGVGRVSF